MATVVHVSINAIFLLLLCGFATVAGQERCNEHSDSTQRRSIMRTLLADYDKATFPSNHTLDVQAEVTFFCSTQSVSVSFDNLFEPLYFLISLKINGSILLI